MTRNEDARQSVQNNADRVHTIGLCMIVKNEAQVITRCLDSVKGLVDYVLIEDTGSTDSTQQVIRDWLKRENMLGEVIEEPWQSFAYNRSHVMAKLGQVEGVDYALIIDADDRIVLEDAFRADAWKAAMDVDLYDVRISHGGARFFRPQICSNRKGFYFKAVLHEYLEGPPEGFTRKNAEGFYIQTGSGGARNKNPRKYQDDAAALEKALQTETDPFLISRYTFYLAQSYRDCGEKELALKNYLKRAEAGYWIEEVFESLYGAAKMKDALDHPEDEVIAAYLKAADTLPTRAEALHGAAKFCRAKGRNEEGYQYAKRGMAIARPGTGLFVESWVYDYGLLDELAVNAYWAGHAQDSLDASLKLLSGNMLPEDQRPRILANARFAFDKLPKEPNLGDAGKASLLDHHAMAPARPLRGRVVGNPRVLIAILAKQKEEMLPLYLECIEALDYPKSQIVLYIRTNNNTDRTEPILREWVERVRPLYADIEFDARDVAEQVQQFGAHEWNTTRFKVLGEIRNLSMRRALEKNCEFYFVADVDNFIRPSTLRELVALDLPIVSPLLRSIERGRYYSNYHAEVDKNGYFISSDQYMWILNQWIRGVVEVPVVHTTYLVRADVISDLNYVDTTGRHEYVIFSDTARKAQIPQYLDNRQVYGYIAFGEGSEQYVEGGIERTRDLLKVALEGDTIVGGTTKQSESTATTSGATTTRRVVSDEEFAAVSEIHLINLDRSKDRLEKFKQRNAHLTNVVRVPAIDGSLVDRTELRQQGLISDDLPYSSGALGCALSHIELWKKAATEDRIVTVCEDDVFFSHYFETTIREILRDVPRNWDFIQWGFNHDPLFVWLNFKFAKGNVRFYERHFSNDAESFQRHEVASNAMGLVHSFGLMAYSITPKGARAFLDGCLPLRKRMIQFPNAGVNTSDEGIDVAMNAVYPAIDAFLCMPPLVMHDDHVASDRKKIDNISQTR